MIPKFLLDENLDPDIAYEVRRRDPAVDIVHVGERGAPPLGTPDPAILDFCEAERRILITNNRASMPRHVADHLAAGKHYWGVLNTRARKPPIGQIVEEILVIAGASEAEEYCDLTDWIP